MDCYGKYYSGERNHRYGKSEIWQGKKNPNYRGGITPLEKNLRRNQFYERWRKSIFERDDYTCQKCGKRGCYLEAHHKNPFVKILNSFLKTNYNLDVGKDKEQLYRLAIKYKPFFDISNGITYCTDCHIKMDKYRGKRKMTNEIKGEQLGSHRL